MERTVKRRVKIGVEEDGEKTGLGAILEGRNEWF